MATLIIVASFISGLVCGHFTISVCESFFHRTIQHAGPRLRHWYEQAGWVGQALLDAWYSHHVVHHFLTFRANHVTQFGSDEERSRLNWRLKTHRINDIIECRYGVILGSQPPTYIEYTAPTLPIFVSLCCLGGGWFTMGACIPFCIWPLLAQFVHPYLGNYILDNGSEMGESVERQAGAILSPEALRAFFRLFVDWLDEGSNRGAIEGYGSGDHEALAILCAAWAAEYRLGQTS